MSRSKLFLEVMTKVWPLGNLGKKVARLPLVDRLIGPLMWNERNMDATYVPIGENVEISESSVVPYQIIERLVVEASNRFIMNRCICRTSMGCQDYPHSIGCVFLGDSVNEINPQFGRRAGVQETLDHVSLAGSHGLLPCILHSSWDAFLLGIKRYDRMLAICFCCDCCCVLRTGMKGGPVAYRDRIIRLSGLVMESGNECLECGRCAQACFLGAIEMTPRGPSFADFCKGCGRCATVCPQDNIRVTFEQGVDTMEELLLRIGARTEIGGPSA